MNELSHSQRVGQELLRFRKLDQQYSRLKILTGVAFFGEILKNVIVLNLPLLEVLIKTNPLLVLAVYMTNLGSWVCFLSKKRLDRQIDVYAVNLIEKANSVAVVGNNENQTPTFEEDIVPLETERLKALAYQVTRRVFGIDNIDNAQS